MSDQRCLPEGLFIWAGLMSASLTALIFFIIRAIFYP